MTLALGLVATGEAQAGDKTAFHDLCRQHDTTRENLNPPAQLTSS
jgi:hypothetical protein